MADIPGDVKVYAGPCDFTSFEQHFIVRLTVGEPSEENEELLDTLLGQGEGSVKAALEQSRQIAGVLKHSGCIPYRLPDGTYRLGAEWTVNVIV